MSSDYSHEGMKVAARAGLSRVAWLQWTWILKKERIEYNGLKLVDEIPKYVTVEVCKAKQKQNMQFIYLLVMWSFRPESDPDANANRLCVNDDDACMTVSTSDLVLHIHHP